MRSRSGNKTAKSVHGISPVPLRLRKETVCLSPAKVFALILNPLTDRQIACRLLIFCVICTFGDKRALSQCTCGDLRRESTPKGAVNARIQPESRVPSPCRATIFLHFPAVCALLQRFYSPHRVHLHRQVQARPASTESRYPLRCKPKNRARKTRSAPLQSVPKQRLRRILTLPVRLHLPPRTRPHRRLRTLPKRASES